MFDLALWPVLTIASAILLVLSWTVALRFHRARRGERISLYLRRRTLRTHRVRRDGRTYNPARNPEFARLLGHDEHQ